MKTEKGLKQAILDLIEAGTSFDVSQLQLIYHKDLEVIKIDTEGNKMIANKEAFEDLFKMKLKNGEAPLSTWSNFHHVNVNKDQGHVILSRKVNLTGTEEQIILSIDLVWESDRWQVTREVIFNDPI